MSRSIMRHLLPLAVVCLLAAQLAAGSRVRTGRMLLADTKSTAVNLSRQQFVQATWALEGVSCADVATTLNDQFVNNTLAKAVISDFQNALNLANWPAAAATVVAVRQPCLDSVVAGKKYASYRTMIRFNSTNSTDVRDLMFAGVATGAANPCLGGFNRLLYPTVAALFAKFKVSQNNGNRQNSFFPDGPGPTGTGSNWVEYASPAMSICQPAPPSPSPSPVASPSPSPVASPSPSPVASPSPSPVASPSPSPSPSPAPLNCSGIPGSVSNGTTCVCNGTLRAFRNNTVVACVAACGGDFPVVGQAVVNTGPSLLCVALSSNCPSELPFAYYGATTAGIAAVLQQCTVAPANIAKCQTAPYTKPVAESDTSVVGCLLDSPTTTVCPIAYGFGLPYQSGATNPPTLAQCRLSTQPNCPTSGFQTQAVTNNTRLDACLSIPAGGSCPTNYPVFAQNNLPYPSAVQPVLMCMNLGSSCPSSTLVNLNFPFQLLNNGAVQGCLAPQVLTTCTGYAPFNGAALFNSVGAPVGCQTPASTACPSGLVPFWNTGLAIPQIVQCRPGFTFGQTCQSLNVNIDGNFYTTNLRSSNGTIIGCLRANQACPNTDVLEAAAAVGATFAAALTNPSDCLPRATPSCPALGYSPARETALYRGISQARTQTTLALPRLFACVPRATNVADPNDCINYGDGTNQFTAEVWGNADATNLIGCAARRGDAGVTTTEQLTPCPASAPFFMQDSTAIAGLLAAASLVECRPAGRTVCAFTQATYSSYTIEMRDVAGNLVGCKQQLSTTAGTGCSVGSSLNDGFPYDFNFPMIGPGTSGAPIVAQCRKTLAQWPTTCSAYTTGGASFSVPLLQGTTINNPAAQTGTLGVLAGCMAAQTRCPTSLELNIFACTYGQGSGATSAICGAPAATAANAFTGFPTPLFSQDGLRIEQCRWNGLGLADVDGAAGLQTAPTTAPTVISVICTAGQGYTTTVTKETYTSVVGTDALAGLPVAAAAADNDGQRARGCLASSANAAACYQLTSVTGFPFATTTGPSQRFIQTIANNGQTAGTLVACANLNGPTADGVNACLVTVGSVYSTFTRSQSGASPQGQFMSGCATGTAVVTTLVPAASATDISNAQTWVTNFYGLFTPRVTASAQ